MSMGVIISLPSAMGEPSTYPVVEFANDKGIRVVDF